MGLWGESAACSLGKVGRNGELKGSRFGRDQGGLRGSDRRRRRSRRAYDVLQGSVGDRPDAAAPVTSIALMVAQPSKPIWPSHRRLGALAGTTDQRQQHVLAAEPDRPERWSSLRHGSSVIPATTGVCGSRGWGGRT